MENVCYLNENKIVISARIETDDKVLKGVYRIVESTDVFEYILEKLYDNVLMKLSAPDILSINDVEIIKELTLEEIKSIEKIRLLDYYTKRLSSYDLYSGIAFVHSAITLAAKGYFIIEENREDKYIEIIETEDENLISELENYLTTMDATNKSSMIVTTINVIRKDIDYAKTEEDVYKIVEAYKNSTTI